jgi:protein TonB
VKSKFRDGLPQRIYIHQPAIPVQGKVFVIFTIDKMGCVINPSIRRGLSADANNEVLRVVQLLEFTPATQNGEPINVTFTLPVTFQP